jgi:hypothetical protein
MSENQIIKETEIKTIAPTEYLELTDELCNKLTSTNGVSAEHEINLGFYTTPDNPLNILKGKHLITIKPYSQLNKEQYLKAYENMEDLKYDPQTSALTEKLLDKQRELLELIFSEETEKYEFTKISKLHEEVHQMQQTRFNAPVVRENTQNIIKFLTEVDPDSGLAKEYRQKVLDLSLWLELQAYQKSLISDNVNQDSKAVYFLQSSCSLVQLFSFEDQTRTYAESFYEILKSGKYVDFDKGIIVEQHMLALTMLLLGNPDLPEDIKLGKMSQQEFNRQLTEKFEELLSDPNPIMDKFSEKDFTMKIDRNLMRSLEDLEKFTEENPVDMSEQNKLPTKKSIMQKHFSSGMNIKPTPHRY